jgi:hypothetical protein
MTITAASNPETVGLDPAALNTLVSAIRTDIDPLLGTMLSGSQIK